MEELWSYLVSPNRCAAKGFALTFSDKQGRSPPPLENTVFADISGSLIVSQQYLGGKKFYFDGVSRQFVSSLVRLDSPLQFSLTGTKVGVLSHRSDREGYIKQDIVSINGSVGWMSEGLKFKIDGDLTDKVDAHLTEGTVDFDSYKALFFEVECLLPWSALKYQFWDFIPFLDNAFRKYGRSSSAPD
jgi:hypothetical protein